MTKPAVATLTLCAALATGAVASAPAAVAPPTVPSGSAVAASDTPAPASETGHFTGKERLGEKWQDEQRIDNCKVPLVRRGSKPRPDSCAHPLMK